MTDDPRHELPPGASAKIARWLRLGLRAGDIAWAMGLPKRLVVHEIQRQMSTDYPQRNVDISERNVLSRSVDDHPGPGPKPLVSGASSPPNPHHDDDETLQEGRRTMKTDVR